MRILLLEADCSTFLLQAEDGQTILVQTDWDFPGVASTFGWSPPPGTPTDPKTTPAPSYGAMGILPETE